jgi:hypothetical protein
MYLFLEDRERKESLEAALADHCDDPAFANEPWEYESNGNGVSFSIALEESEFASFEAKLDQLLGFVVPFLKSVENIQKYFVV